MKLRHLTSVFLICLTSIYIQAFYYWNETGMRFNKDNIFELLTEYFGEEKLRAITDSNNCSASLMLKYKLDGDLVQINTLKQDYMYFTEEEWENIFDFFHSLPPFDLPNPHTYVQDSLFRYISDPEKKREICFNSLIYTSFMPQYLGISDGAVSKKPDSISIFDWIIRKSHEKPFPFQKESLDSIFGDMKWEELKYRYNKAIDQGTFVPKYYGRTIFAKGALVETTDYKRNGYSWKKIPIKIYNVNIQIPVGSKIEIANDTLSANVVFPDSTYISIKYTKGLPNTKLTENEVNPRKRRISNAQVTDKIVTFRGNFERDRKKVYWQRDRYRYGVTLTLYTSSSEKATEYYKSTLGTATIVMRPKYKTIYLKD